MTENKYSHPRIALIHATPLAMEPIAQAFAKHWPQAQCMHLLDDTLSKDRAKDGVLTNDMVDRFKELSTYSKQTGAQGILFTCSAFGPAIDAAHAHVRIPTHKPNQAMFEDALSKALKGKNLRVGLMATFEASIGALSEEFLELAKTNNIHVQMESVFVKEAMQDLANGQAQLHHQKIAACVSQLSHCDVIMLAQFSMAAAQPLAQEQTTVPVLSSPDCAAIALREKMRHE